METRSVERNLAAIFAVDVEGYSRLMGQDEVGTLRTLTTYRAIIDDLIASHRGRIFNTAGGSVLADFASAIDAVQCAVAVQETISKENADRSPRRGDMVPNRHPRRRHHRAGRQPLRRCRRGSVIARLASGFFEPVKFNLTKRLPWP